MMALPRILTALLGAPLILASVWCGNLPYLALTAGLVFLALWEFYALCESGGYPAQRGPGIGMGMLLILSLYLAGAPVDRFAARPATPFVLTLCVLASFLIEFARRDKGHSLLRIATTLLGLLFIAWPLGHLLLLRDLRMDDSIHLRIGRELAFLAVLTLWVQDIGAWLIGNWMGRRRLASQISPRKTWEGAVGGTLLGVLFGILFRELFLQAAMGRVETAVVCAGFGALGQISDLAASFVKRSLGAKDFSDLLPGHGGILDRFDSFLFTIPVFYYYLLGTGRFQ